MIDGGGSEPAGGQAEQGLAREIRRLRQAAGLSQAELADRVGFSREYVSRAERPSRGLPSESLITSLDHGLGAGGALVRTWAEAAGVRRHRRERVAASDWRDHAEPIHCLDGVAPDETAAEARAAARLVREVSAGSVSGAVLDRMDTEVRRIARDYIAQPAVDLLDDIRELRAEVVGLVETNRMPGQLRQLYLNASLLGGLQAHACLDLGHHHAAAVHARTAWWCADQADHHGARAWVRGVQSIIAYWADDFADAVSLARDGARYRAGSLDGDRIGSIGARLPCMEARAAARMRDERGTLEALDRADSARERVEVGQETGMFEFPIAKQFAYAGTTLLSLGGPVRVRAAAAASNAALAAYEAAAPADRSPGDILAARLDLARAHLTLGELDTVREHLTTVLQTPVHRRTASIRTRTRQLGERIGRSRWSGARDAASLREEIDAFCSASNRPRRTSSSAASSESLTR